MGYRVTWSLTDQRPLVFRSIELLNGGLASGSTRVLHQLLVTLQMGLGLAFGVFCVDWWTGHALGPVDVCGPGGLPLYVTFPLMITVGFVCFNVLLNAHPRAWLIMNVAAAAGLCVSQWGSQSLGADGSTVLAAFAVGTVASAMCLAVRVRPLSYFYVSFSFSCWARACRVANFCAAGSLAAGRHSYACPGLLWSQRRDVGLHNRRSLGWSDFRS